MNHVAPPLWLQRLLSFLLPRRNRETVAGDLYEEFQEEKVPRLGFLRAGLWYMRQVLSFAPEKVRASLAQRSLLTLLCLFTAMSGSWLGLMELLLRHPGYAGREGIAGTIVVQALLTLGALRFHRSALLAASSMAGTFAIFWLAGTVFLATLHGARPEGYVILIALALIVQGLLTLSTLPRVNAPPGHNV